MHIFVAVFAFVVYLVSEKKISWETMRRCARFESCSYAPATALLVIRDV